MARTRPSRWLREAAVFAYRTSFASTSHRGPRRELPARNSAPPEAEDENFPGCKALKYHEMGLESMDATKPVDQRSPKRSNPGATTHGVWVASSQGLSQ
jgi:hypothetical protein